MPIIGNDSNSEYFRERSRQKDIPNAKDSTRPLTKDEMEVKKLSSLLNELSANSGKKSDNSLETYLNIVSDYSNKIGSTVNDCSSFFEMASQVSESLQGFGVFFFAGIDASKTYSTHKQIQARRAINANLKWSLKSFSKNMKTFKVKERTKRNIQSNSRQTISKETIKNEYNESLNALLNSKNLSKSAVIEKLNTAIFIKEYLNNLDMMELGQKFGFLTAVKTDYKNGIEIFAINHDKVPEAINKMQEDIRLYHHEKRSLGHGDGARIHLLERTLQKLQMIEVHAVLERIEKITNKRDKFSTAINGFKTIGACIGFGSAVSLLAVPPSAIVTIPVFASGLAIRASATVAEFIKNKIDSRSHEKSAQHNSEVEKKITDGSLDLIAQFFEPIIAEKYPETFKILQNTINEVDQNTNNIQTSAQHLYQDLHDTAQERILQKFETNLNNSLLKNPKLKQEWTNLESEWTIQKNELAITQKQKEIRAFSERSIKEISNFLVDKISTLKDVENSHNLVQAIDALIEAKNMANILTLIGIQRNGITPSSFIQKSLSAHQKASNAQYETANQLTSNMNISTMMLEMTEKMNRLITAGQSKEHAATYLAHEMESAIQKQLTLAQKKNTTNDGVEEAAVLKYKLCKSFEFLLQK